MKKEGHWSALTDEQLRGADFALCLLHTSPRIRGAALELLVGLIAETRAEMSKRNRAARRATQGEAKL